MKSETTLLAALQNKEERAIRYVYWGYYDSVEKYVAMNSGTSEDAEDIFQEGLLVLLEKINQPSFELTSSIKTFLFAICKNLWLREINKNKNMDRIGFADVNESFGILDSESSTDTEAEWDSMQQVMKEITSYCSKLLIEMFVEGKVTTVYKNVHAKANQKYKCLQQAKKAAKKIKQLHG
ncbi:MAG: sigma-70 family RNA polymerase sigma factor [Cytophagales bacterium]|nr:sigma-70 family RNA polymerase sigma factor [Cytophagales bacterium]